MAQMSSSKKQKYDHGQRTDWWLPRGGVLGEGWTGSLGLVDAKYYVKDR